MAGAEYSKKIPAGEMYHLTSGDFFFLTKYKGRRNLFPSAPSLSPFVYPYGAT
jgi:hypothetical protein